MGSSTTNSSVPGTVGAPELGAAVLGQLRHELQQGRLRDRTQAEPVPLMLVLDLLAG